MSLRCLLQSHQSIKLKPKDSQASYTQQKTSVPQISLNWLMQRPAVSSIIVAARNEEQLKQNLAAFGWSLAVRSRSAQVNLPSKHSPLGYLYKVKPRTVL